MAEVCRLENREEMVNVLFVCMGNICRSPTAEGVFSQLVRERGLDDRIRVDSAGTLSYHAGEAPDERAQETTLKYGIDIGQQQARQVCIEDFERFHYVLAMDDQNHMELKELCPPEKAERLHLFCDFATSIPERVVPDPYYGGEDGFDKVFRIIRLAADGLIESIIADHFPDNGR